MTNWDAPQRGRAFLTAALLVTICGMLFSWTDTTPTLAATDAGPRPSLSRPLGAGFAAPAPAVPEEALDADLAENSPVAGADERVELRDAVAAAPSPAASLPAGPAGTTGAWTAASRAAVAPRDLPSAGSEARRAAAELRRPAAPAAAPRAGLAKRTLASLSDSAAPSPASSSESAQTGFTAALRRAAAAPAPKGSAPVSGGGVANSASAAAAAAAPSAAASSAGAAASSAGARPASRLARLKPVLLNKLLGPHPLRPPRGAIKPPAKNPWKTQPPRPGVLPMPLSKAELLTPPAEKVRGAVAVEREGRGAWLEEVGGHWWLWPSPDGPALLSHEGHWWWQSRGVWFLLHDGEPWGWRYLNDWRQEGLQHGSGAKMIYSADGLRVGVVVPGEGAVLYDSRTGAELGRWSAAELPRAASPKAPSRLRLP